jgi:hypothetical protein
MKIDLRVERLVPADAVPGDGLRSSVLDELVSIATDVDAMPPEEARRTTHDPVMTVVKRLALAHRRQWRIEDASYSKMKDPATQRLLEQAQAQAAGGIPTMGHASPSDLWTAQASERARVLREFQRQVTEATVGSMAKQIAAEGEAVLAAVTEAQDAIEEAISDFEAPSGLRDDIQLTDLQRRADIEQEFLSWGGEAMGKALEALERTIALKRDDKRDERLKNLLPACLRAASQVLSTPPAKLAARRAAQASGRLYEGQFADALTEQARAVIARVREWKESQRPQSIEIAKTSMVRLRIVFEAILGKSADFMSRLQRETIYGSGDLAHLGRAWELDDAWPFRFAPPHPHGLRLPAWSRMIMKTDRGLPVRAPASVAPLVNAEVRIDPDRDEAEEVA